VYVLLKSLRKVFKLVVSETAILSISAGFAVGMVLGLTPLLKVHTVLLLALVMIFRINLSAVFTSMGVFKLVGIPLWPTFHGLGASLLSDPARVDLWTTVTHTPGLNLLDLNNSQVLGSLLVSAGLFPVVLIVGTVAVKWGRRVFTEERQSHWLARMVTKSRIFGAMVKWAGD
jgi:uncharacterized protein (TIGR03546 family)